MRRTHLTAAALALTITALPAALAQDEASEQPQEQPQAQPAAPVEVTWSEEEFGRIADALTGSWKTTGPVGDTDPIEICMSVAPVRLDALPDALYVEIARADSLDRPYSKSFLQLYRRQGAIRMRTLELRDPNSDTQNMVVGLWAAPEHMPQVRMEDLRGTLDLELTSAGDGWVGETPYPYPNASNGAVEMTSHMKIAPGRLETADRGYDADGNVVWGASEGDSYVFEPVEPYFATERTELGLVAITLRDDTAEPPFADGDNIAFQYTGWIADGTMFDTSRRQGKRPLQYQAPQPPSGLIEGWKLGVDGMSKGDWRKFVVPSQLGYGPSGAGGGMIPPNSTLIFEAELVYVQAPPEPQEPEAPADAGGAGGGGGGR
jgi:hypothetical protein